MTDQSKTKEQLIEELSDLRGRVERLGAGRTATAPEAPDDAASRFAQFESIINQSPAVVFRWRVADDWPVESVSENVKQFGYTAEELMSGRVSWTGMTHPDDVPRLEAEIAGNLESSQTEFAQEYRLITKSGDIRWIEDWNVMLQDADGVTTHIHGLVFDITKRKRAEAALRESEERFRSIFEDSLIGVYRTTPAGRVLAANPAAVRMLGCNSFEELAERNLEKDPVYEPGYERSEFKDRIERDDQVIGLEAGWTRRDGTPVYVRESAVAIRNDAGEIVCYQGTLEDITERKQAEQELLAYQEQLRSLSSELALAEERERRRIANSLHDDLGQILSLARIKLGELGDAAAKARASGAYDHVCELLEEAIEKIRTLTFDLGSPVLHTLGLEAAVEQLAEHLAEKHGIAVSVKNSHRPLLLSDDIRIVLFQIVRELLRNVERHADAGCVTVSFRESDGVVRVTVEDDGAGFDPSAPLSRATAGGFGLFSIRERMNHLGGTFEVESEPGRGTRAVVTAPRHNGDAE